MNMYRLLLVAILSCIAISSFAKKKIALNIYTTDGFHNIPVFSSLNVWTETEELIGFGCQIHQNFVLQLEECYQVSYWSFSKSVTWKY